MNDLKELYELNAVVHSAKIEYLSIAQEMSQRKASNLVKNMQHFSSRKCKRHTAHWIYMIEIDVFPPKTGTRSNAYGGILNRKSVSPFIMVYDWERSLHNQYTCTAHTVRIESTLSNCEWLARLTRHGVPFAIKRKGNFKQFFFQCGLARKSNKIVEKLLLFGRSWIGG